MNYKCKKCQDTGSLSQNLAGSLDCISCDVATDRVAMGEFLDKLPFMGDYDAAWLVHQRALAMAFAAPQVVADERIAGALFDLMGFLTTSETRYTFSAYDEASPAVEALQEFAKKRGLNLSEADVAGWRTGCCSSAPVQAQEPEWRKQYELLLSLDKRHIPANFTTHRESWRCAIEDKISATRGDDQAYWRHELAAYDRAFTRLLSGELSHYQQPAAPVQPVAVPDGWRDAALESAVQAVVERVGESEKIDIINAFDAIRSLKKNRHALPESCSSFAAPAAQGDAKDAERLEFIENSTVDLRCHSAPTGGDDSDIHWNVIEHHMAAPNEREIGWGNTARQAIDAAIAAKAAS